MLSTMGYLWSRKCQAACGGGKPSIKLFQTRDKASRKLGREQKSPKSCDKRKKKKKKEQVINLLKKNRPTMFTQNHKRTSSRLRGEKGESMRHYQLVPHA